MTTAAMSQVRIFGDPFAGEASASALRVFLQLCFCSGMTVAIRCKPEPGSDSAEIPQVSRAVLPAAERALILAALDQVLPSTAPVVVFSPHLQGKDALELANLMWPKSCRVMLADRQRAEDLLHKVRAELRWAGTEDPDHSVDALQLRAWLRMAPPAASGPVLHLGARDPAAGTDVAVRVFARHFAANGHRLRVLLPNGDPSFCGTLRHLAAEYAPQGVDAVAAIEIVIAPLTPEIVLDCVAVMQPMRNLHDAEALVCLLASGRPVVATASRATAPIFAARDAFVPVGGRWLTMGGGLLDVCEPDMDSLADCLHKVLCEPRLAKEIGLRGRNHVIAELTADRPAAPPIVSARRTTAKAHIVLEAPFFAHGAASEVAIASALALLRRDNVHLQLVATQPFRTGLAEFRNRAPGLAPLFSPNAAAIDLWLASGLPLRNLRPKCSVFAQRFDWEYGALPSALSPLLVQECDQLVVHSNHVQRTLTSGGRSAEGICLIPHGVDAELFNETKQPLAEIVQWKGSLPAVLFVGELSFRKGFDLFLRATLAAARQGLRFCVVVKACAGEQQPVKSQLGGLIERFQRTPGAPSMLFLDRQLSRSEMAGVFRACDLLLHPYRGEGFGLPVLEARACGLPVLITKGGATDSFAVGAGVVTIDSKRRLLDLATRHLAEPWLLEPEGASLAAALSDSLRGLNRLQHEARGVASVVRESFSWDRAALSIEQLGERAMTQSRAGKPAAAAVVAPRHSLAL
ncbi:hypothetical protein LBMAG49_08860 [Planctomycetota bacterium]|nr:hypothetical protein LBMAG49_08860 [Planctomycetota bacterium]